MVIDHGKFGSMQRISISEFKATCLAVLERVRTTGEPVLVTKRGQPVAEIVPPTGSGGTIRPLGDLAATARIRGDIVSSVVTDDEWDVFR